MISRESEKCQKLSRYVEKSIESVSNVENIRDKMVHPEFTQISLEGYEIAENNKRNYEDNEIKSKLFSLGNLRIMTIRSNSGKDTFLFDFRISP